MFKRLKSEKAFTLIELIVVMAIIGVLVLLAMPKFMGYTKKANLTKHISTAKELETASERYYIDYQKWPRFSDEPYSESDIKEYATKIYDLTGKEVELDVDGHYYDIDYNALSKYIRVPRKEDRLNYILQNPVGKVYFFEGLTDLGKNRVDFDDKNVGDIDGSNKNEGIINIKKYNNDATPIVFHGLSTAAFDNDLSTFHLGVGTVTWEGNLTHREIEITGMGNNGSNSSLMLMFYDDDDNVITPVGSTGNEVLVALWDKKVHTVKVIVPEGATKMNFYSQNGKTPGYLRIYEIKVPDRLERPDNIKLMSNTTHYSIELNWENLQRAVIYKDGKLLSNIDGQTYLDKPLYSNTEHIYDIIFINEYGNGKQITYKAKTNKNIVDFRGLSPVAFDTDLNTYHLGVGVVTWEGSLTNREVQITGMGFNGSNSSLMLMFYDDNNNVITPVGSTDNGILIAIWDRQIHTTKVMVPEGATKMNFYSHNGSSPGYMQIYEIKVVE